MFRFELGQMLASLLFNLFQLGFVFDQRKRVTVEIQKHRGNPSIGFCRGRPCEHDAPLAPFLVLAGCVFREERDLRRLANQCVFRRVRIGRNQR